MKVPAYCNIRNLHKLILFSIGSQRRRRVRDFLFGLLLRKLGTRILLPPALLSKQQDSPQLPQWIVNPFRTTQAHQTRVSSVHLAFTSDSLLLTSVNILWKPWSHMTDIQLRFGNSIPRLSKSISGFTTSNKIYLHRSFSNLETKNIQNKPRDERNNQNVFWLSLPRQISAFSSAFLLENRAQDLLTLCWSFHHPEERKQTRIPKRHKGVFGGNPKSISLT